MPFCLFAACFFAAAPALAGYAVFPSSSAAQSVENVPPSSALNTAGALRGVIAPAGLRKRDWSAGLVFFSDSLRSAPALELGSGKGKTSLRLLYCDSRLPAIKDKGSFLRASGVNVKENITSVLIGQSTAAYSSDAVDGFRTRTRSLTFYFGREVYQGEFTAVSFLAGAGAVYRFYSVSCVLADNSAFTERSSSYGFLLSPGIEVILSAPSVVKRGFAASLHLAYNKVWLGGAGKKLARPLRKELEGPRFGFGLAWRFNFYE